MKDINELIDEAIDLLADDDISQGADAIYEIARQFSLSGLGQASFQNVRTYIVKSAEAKTDAFFITEKLKIIERKMYEQRARTEKAKAWTKTVSGS